MGPAYETSVKPPWQNVDLSALVAPPPPDDPPDPDPDEAQAANAMAAEMANPALSQRRRPRAGRVARTAVPTSFIVDPYLVAAIELSSRTSGSPPCGVPR